MGHKADHLQDQTLTSTSLAWLLFLVSVIFRRFVGDAMATGDGIVSDTETGSRRGDFNVAVSETGDNTLAENRGFFSSRLLLSSSRKGSWSVHRFSPLELPVPDDAEDWESTKG